MGWLKIGYRTESAAATRNSFKEDLKFSTEHIENIRLEPQEATEPYPKVGLSVPDSDLPFISPREIAQRVSKETGGLRKLLKHTLLVKKANNEGVIVVDNIVYDCANFLQEHPGGEQVIKSFAGAECSWQFWRFHGRKEMDEFGRALRVGRTKGIVNKFLEPKKYVGLRRLGGDEWF